MALKPTTTITIECSSDMANSEKAGTNDIEAQEINLVTTMESNSDAGSNDQLVGSTSSTDKFVSHGPPTLWETACCVLFAIVGNGACIVALIHSEPNERPIPVQHLEGSDEYVHNGTNNEIYNGETVPTLWALGFCVILPGCLQALYGVLKGQPGDFYRTINTYCIAFTLCSIATEFIKNYVGYLRPIFMDQCNPDEDYETCLGRYEDYDHFGVKELRKSFISGHASFAFCGGVLFSMFLERTIGISSVQVAVTQQLLPNTANRIAMAYKSDPGLRRFGSVLALAPMAVSIFVACSRLVDNVHFPADVVGGAVVGASIAYYCFPIWYSDPRFVL